MELMNIEKLIEKYFEGQTTLAEETTLRQYFTTNKVPAHLQSYQDLFGYFKTKQLEVTNRPITLSKRIKFPYKWLSVAAMVIFVLGIYIFNTKPNKPSQAQLLKDYQTTQQALQMISKNLNKGTYAMAQLQEFDITKNKIFKK